MIVRLNPLKFGQLKRDEILIAPSTYFRALHPPVSSGRRYEISTKTRLLVPDNSTRLSMHLVFKIFTGASTVVNDV